MARHNARLGTLTISSGQTASTALSSIYANTSLAMGVAVDFVVYAPAALTGTVTAQASPVQSPSAGDWKNITVAGTAITIPAGAAVVIPLVAMFDFRLNSGSAEGADRDFVVVVQYDT